MFRKLIQAVIYKLGRLVHTWYRVKMTRSRDAIHGIVDRAYFKDTAGFTREKRKIDFYTIAWGNYLESFFAYTAPSLLQEGNIPSLARAGYELKLSLYVEPSEYQEMSERYSECWASLKKFMSINITPLEFQNGRTKGHYMRLAFVDQIKRSIDEESMMFFTPPDTMFGNRSIFNAVETVRGKNVCLSAASARIVWNSVESSEAFDGLKKMDRIVENDEMVDFAFENGHPALLDAFDNEDSNRTLAGGISIRKLNNNAYSVIHNLPSVWVANFVADDLKLFLSMGQPKLDSGWLRVLLRHNRLKVVGSSDLFFCVERTANTLNVPAMGQGLLNNDSFLTRGERYLHSYVFNSYCSVWRGRGVTNADTLGEEMP